MQAYQSPRIVFVFEVPVKRLYKMRKKLIGYSQNSDQIEL